MSRTSQGRSIANLLAFQPNEKVANVLAIKDFTQGEQFLMFATAKGTVKKTALSAYANIRQNGIIAIGWKRATTLIDVAVTSGKDHVILGTKSGLAIRFEEADVRAMGRPAGGVTGARFKREGDAVVSMLIVHNGDNTKLQGADRLRQRLRQAHAARRISRQRPRHARRHQHRRQRPQRRRRRHETRHRHRRSDAHHGKRNPDPHAQSAKSAKPAATPRASA